MWYETVSFQRSNPLKVNQSNSELPTIQLCWTETNSSLEHTKTGEDDLGAQTSVKKSVQDQIRIEEVVTWLLLKILNL